MGIIRWFVRNQVAANLLMVLILLAGLVTVFGLPLGKLIPGAPIIPPVLTQEVFPEINLGLVTVSVPYRGAAPEEVEEAICIRVEEEIQDIDGVKELRSVAAEGLGLITAEVRVGEDVRRVADDIKAAVDAIDTFPEQTDKPVIRQITNRLQVIDLAIYGNADEKALRELAERIRDDLTALDAITLVELGSGRPYEISIEVSELDLRRWGLTLDQVANAVRRSSLDLPGGSVKTAGGEILLRSKGQAYRGPEFESLVLLTRPDGSDIRLGDVATVVDGFEETDQLTRFDGQPAAIISVFRVGDQDAIRIAEQVEAYVESARERLPTGMSMTTWNDASRILKGRRNLLLKNGAGGLLLVVLILALFLQFRLAIWVALGMTMAFLGAIWVMPVLGVTINLISLFAFILVLGIVVDDAIIVGENIHSRQQQLGDGLRGAIEGAEQISKPVVFAVLTTVAAFTPLLNVEGSTGKIMRTIPLIVIPCLLWSLVESLWILPAHLSHMRVKERNQGGLWHRFQSRFAQGLESFINRAYAPTIELCLRWRYATVGVGLALMLVTVGIVQGGFLRFIFFPDVEADLMSASLVMPKGSPIESTSEAVRRLEASYQQLRREITEETGEEAFVHQIAAIGEQPFKCLQRKNAGGAVVRCDVGSELGEMTVELAPAESRSIASADLAARWRELTGPIPDALELNFSASLFSPGDDINIQLTGQDLDALQGAAEELKGALAQYTGVFDIKDTFVPGKREMKLGIKPEAELLGLTLSDLARQVRQAFFGEEAQRIQRGRDDLRVMVRYPRAERRSLGDVEQMRIRTASGAEVPFSEVATAQEGRGFASITRVDRRRAVNVIADVDNSKAAAGQILTDLRQTILPQLTRDHPGVYYTFEGQQAEQRDTIGGLARGFALALVLIYALLAIPLRSYVQPLIIMAAIPFGLIGAILGHLLLGLDLTILSMFGLVALTGVVVNDSLVMVDFINRHKTTADELQMAVRNAGIARFRPILLTSLTTFFGLFPLMMERSMQARFLIPMAVSLAFGVMFATTITLVLVPAGYTIVEDLRGLLSRRSTSQAS